MMATLVAALILVITFGSPLGGQDWDQANSDTRRLEPPSFPQLPPAITENLRQRGCTVPQPSTSTRPVGVIRGHFTSTDRFDWAVLCSVARVSRVLVFRGGSVTVVDEFAQFPDATFLQVVGPGNAVGFSRAIGVASPSHIRSHGKQTVVARVDHDGIEDAFIQKGSTIWYWFGGEWHELPGAD